MNTLASAVGLSVDVVAELVRAFASRRLTIATAESLTGGLLTAVLTEIPGSSVVVRGGLVVYATDLKQELAGVDAALLAAHGPVDPLVAYALAQGARLRCGASVGIGLTGVAGPDPQNDIPVGTWFCAVVGPGEHREERHGSGGTHTRAQVRAAAVRSALEMLTNIVAMDS